MVFFFVNLFVFFFQVGGIDNGYGIKALGVKWFFNVIFLNVYGNWILVSDGGVVG